MSLGTDEAYQPLTDEERDRLADRRADYYDHIAVAQLYPRRADSQVGPATPIKESAVTSCFVCGKPASRLTGSVDHAGEHVVVCSKDCADALQADQKQAA